MAKLTFSLSGAHLRAALILAGNRDVRFYLNGVQIEAHADRLFLVATDGARLGVFRVPYRGPAVQFLVPRDLIEPIKVKRGELENLELEYDTETHAIRVAHGAVSLTGKAIDGRFPDWRRVFPVKPSGEAGQFDAEFIADFAKLAKVLGHKSAAVRITHNGENSARVSVSGADYFAGVLMPLRLTGQGVSQLMTDAVASALIEAPGVDLKLAA